MCIDPSIDNCAGNVKLSTNFETMTGKTLSSKKYQTEQKLFVKTHLKDI